MSSIAYAAGAGTTAATGTGFNAFIPIILMFAIFYFLLIRPQQKKTKEHQAVLSQLKKGDKVLTAGGIHGEISGIKDDIITVEIAPKVRIRVSRGSIAGKN